MDEKSLLLAQVRALIEQLEWAEKSLRTAKIEPKIREAASVGFEVLFKQRGEELTRLEKSIPSSTTYAGSWKQLRKFSSSSGELFKECLGFLGGALLRGAHGENDICEIADALLVELSSKTPIEWKGVTLLAESHFYTETTGLIRLPFPDYGIWNLPIAVHELGHFIAPGIRNGIGGLPFHDFLARKTQDNLLKVGSEPLSGEEVERQLSHLRELLSDLFAVYALGPAYACSCILLRFDPLDCIACEDGDTHPSHDKRVHFILKGLEQMSKNGWPYGGIVSNLRVLWEWNLRRAGRENCLGQTKTPPLNSQLVELYPILTKFMPTVKYKGWDRAIELSHRLPFKGNGAVILNNQYEISDVINAAWLWRLQQKVENSNTVHQVNLQAIALCREIIRRRQAPTIQP